MKHFYIRMSEDEFTDCQKYGIWELERDTKPLIIELIKAKKEHEKWSGVTTLKLRGKQEELVRG